MLQIYRLLSNYPNFLSTFFYIKMKAIERLYQYLDYKCLKPTALEKEIGLSNGYLGNQRKRNADMGEGAFNKIIDYCRDINPVWLLTGKGDMINEDNTIKEMLSNNPSIGVPYFDVDFAAGFGDMDNDQTIVPTNNIVFAPFRDATCWCNVTGHSMEPRINHGDIIALKECTINDIQYGEIYAVVLDTFRTIKILRKSPDPEKFLFVPINNDYDVQEFDKSRILKIYGVMGAISKFF